MRRGRIAWGERRREMVVALAGVLAECGARELEWQTGVGDVVVVRARETDLPGMLASGEGVLRWRAGGVEIVVGRDAMEWASADGSLGDELGAIGGG